MGDSELYRAERDRHPLLTGQQAHELALAAIRADERAKIVAMLEAMAKEKFTEPASNDLLRAAKRVLSGEHRPKPGQPKEGE